LSRAIEARIARLEALAEGFAEATLTLLIRASYGDRRAVAELELCDAESPIFLLIADVLDKRMPISLAEIPASDMPSC
jgi:hypothetical protein